MAGFFPKGFARAIAYCAADLQELVADIDRRVRPRALCQVLDDRRDALVAFNE